MDEAFEKYLQRFLKRYGVNPDDIVFDSVSGANAILRQLKTHNINLSNIEFHLRKIFDFYKNGINLYDTGFKETTQYSNVNNQKIPINENNRVTLEYYIERFLLESIYAMGNPYPLKDCECKLAKAIMTKAGHRPDDCDAKDNPKIDTMNYPDKITGEIKVASDAFVKKLCRPLPFVTEPGKMGYGPGGLIPGLKRHLNFDITLFTAKEHEAEICKIVYFFDELRHRFIPELQGRWGKSSNVMDFLSQPSMENVAYSSYGRETYNGKITRLIKNKLETEMSLKEASRKEIYNIRSALNQVSATWNNLLNNARTDIDAGKELDFDIEFRVMESILGKPHKVVKWDNVRSYAPKAKFFRKELKPDRGTRVLKSLLNRLHKADEDTSSYTFKKTTKGKELDFDQGIRELEFVLDKQYEVSVATWDDVRAYTFKLTGPWINHEIQVWKSKLRKSQKEMDGNIYQASPITALYLKISQFERLGELEDKRWVNSIKIYSNYNAQEFVRKMKPYIRKRIDVDSVEKYINNKKIDEIAKFIYLKPEITGKERQGIKDSKWKLPIVLECCTHTRTFINIKDKVPELLIISCLQAILTDKEGDVEYTFYNYQEHMGTHRLLNIDLNKATKGKYLVEATKLCWARKVENHWYANIGKYEQWRKFREYENKIYDVLTKIYSCPNISEMLSANQDYYGKLKQIGTCIE